MTAKDVLGLIVRLFGLLLMVCGIYGEIYALMELAGYKSEARYTTTVHVVYGLILLVLGYVVIKAAPAIENFCYKTKKPK